MCFKIVRWAWGIVLLAVGLVSSQLSGGKVKSYLCKRGTWASWGRQRGGDCRPTAVWITGDSPCRGFIADIVCPSTCSSPRRQKTTARDRTQARVWPSAAAPRCAAWRSMLNNEPKGHTGSFVRWRVSPTATFIYYRYGFVFTCTSAPLTHESSSGWR